MNILRILTLFILFAASPAWATDDSITAQFRALEVAWHNAIKAHDRAKLELFLSPDYTLTVAVADGLRKTDRASWLNNSGSVYVLHEFQFDDLVVRQYGDTAVVSSRYKQRATVNGRDRSGEFFLTDVWIKTGDTWQVSARYSSRPEPGKPSPVPASSSK